MKSSLTFLLDEDLASKSVLAALRRAGLDVTSVPEQFGKGCKDVDWLPAAGAHGWVVLTKDKAIRRSPLEVAAVRDARVCYFSLTRGNLTAVQMCTAILAAVPQIEGIVRSRSGRRAVLARITAEGRVNVGETWP